MDEYDWVTSNGIQGMLNIWRRTRQRLTVRKARLIIYAMVRRYDGCHVSDATFSLIDRVADRCAPVDSVTSDDYYRMMLEMRAHPAHLHGVLGWCWGLTSAGAPHNGGEPQTGEQVLFGAAHELLHNVAVADLDNHTLFAYRMLPDIARDILGNPFRPSHDWGLFRTTEVSERVRAFQDGLIPRLAQSIYDTHDWGNLEPLIDALQEAGVPHRGDVIQHLLGKRPCTACFTPRNPGEETAVCPACDTTGWIPMVDPRHHRGCWVVDAILGKE